MCKTLRLRQYFDAGDVSVYCDAERTGYISQAAGIPVEYTRGRRNTSAKLNDELMG